VPSEVCQSFIGGGIPIGTPRQGEWIRKVAYHFGYGIGFRESMEPSFHFYGEYPLPILTLRGAPGTNVQARVPGVGMARSWL
jgi:hypothetical protein